MCCIGQQPARVLVLVFGFLTIIVTIYFLCACKHHITLARHTAQHNHVSCLMLLHWKTTACNMTGAPDTQTIYTLLVVYCCTNRKNHMCKQRTPQSGMYRVHLFASIVQHSHLNTSLKSVNVTRNIEPTKKKAHPTMSANGHISIMFTNGCTPINLRYVKVTG